LLKIRKIKKKILINNLEKKMSETALLLYDLYDSLCLKPVPSEDFLKLRKLRRFFHAFMACWNMDESCPKMPNNNTMSNDCDYIKASLDWLSSQGQDDTTRMFKRLIAENVEENMNLLRSHGVYDEDILELNNFVALEDDTQFNEKMREISDILSSQTNSNKSMTLLGLLGALTISKVPTNNQTKVTIESRVINDLTLGDIIYKTQFGYSIINPMKSLENATMITGDTYIYLGEVIIMALIFTR